MSPTGSEFLLTGRQGESNFNHSQAIFHSLSHDFVSCYDSLWGFPGDSSGKESDCWHKRCTFDPWVGKIPERRKWQPIPVFLPGESHGQRSLVCYSPQGCKESDTTISAHTHMRFYHVKLEMQGRSHSQQFREV